MSFPNGSGFRPYDPGPGDRVETCWRVIAGPIGMLITCAIYRTAPQGVELRVSYSGQCLLHAQLVADTEAARGLAHEWLLAARISGGFQGLS